MDKWIKEGVCMKLSCVRENLHKGLSIVGRIAKSQTTLPVLSNVLLKTEEGRLKISATDLELGITYYIGAKVEKDGAITVPAKLLIEYIMMNNDETINLEVSDNTLSLESKRYKTKIKGIDASEFPLIPQVKEEPTLNFEPNYFKEAISQVIIAPSIDETKPVLSGILLKIDENEVKLVATDSFRLAEKKLSLEKPTGEKNQVIIPSKTLSEVSRLITLANPSSVLITLSANQILFILDEIRLVSRIIEGNFPEYESIIPKNIETESVLEVADFQNGLKIAQLFARESGNNVRLKIKKDKMIIQAESSLTGEHSSTIIASTSGNETEISFNIKFLLDVLAVIPSSKIILGISGKLSPSVIRPFGKKDYLYLIMPLQTEE